MLNSPFGDLAVRLAWDADKTSSVQSPIIRHPKWLPGDTRMNDQSVGLAKRSSTRFRTMLFVAAPNMQHRFGFHMDIQRMLWSAIENLIYGPTKNQHGV